MALGLATAGMLTGIDREASAAGGREATAGTMAPAEPTVPLAWGLRLNGAVGVAGFSQGGDAGGAWRVGLDAEYWLSKNIGIGGQLGLQALKTFDICLSGTCDVEMANRVSIAPSVTLRGNNPANFPILSLAAGFSWGHVMTAHDCDPSDSCQESQSAADSWGPYASLTAAWVFHPGHLRPASGAFAIGPMVRLDWFSLRDTGSSWPDFSVGGWTFTAGMTMGVDFTRAATR